MPVSRKLSAFALVAWVAIAFPPLAFSGGDWPDGLINSGSRTSFVQTIIALSGCDQSFAVASLT
jgi:hypothetical protein